MTPARTLLHSLLGYIYEQAKDIDPRGYRLSAAQGFLRRRDDIIGLPGVEFDAKVAGDHIWLRVERLEAKRPPSPSQYYKSVFRISDDPNAPAPTLEEAGFLHWLNQAGAQTTEDGAELEKRERTRVAEALEDYTALWSAWAAGERPRRTTIDLYGDLFALKHQLEAEETVRPQEFVWGVGVSSWQLDFDGSSVSFEYPLLTQAVEITLDEETLALAVRPRATDTRVELDAVIGCQVAGAADVERAMREHLASHRDRPVSPFDTSTYSDVLKLAAGNLDGKGTYLEVAAASQPVPGAGEHLVVTDAWALISRARSNNYLFEDLRRLQSEREGGCEIPEGPLALVSPPLDEAFEYEAVRFRGLSSRGDTGAGPTEELYFPLPYNDEQITIVQRLACRHLTDDEIVSASLRKSKRSSLALTFSATSRIMSRSITTAPLRSRHINSAKCALGLAL